MRINRRQFLIFLLIFQTNLLFAFGFEETIEHFLNRKIEVIRKKTTDEVVAGDDQLLSESNVEAIVESKDPIDCIGNLKFLLKNRLPFVLSSEASIKNFNATGSFIQIANKRKLHAKFIRLLHSKINRLFLRSSAHIPVMALNEKLVENNIAIGKITSSINSQVRAEDGEDDEGKSLKNLTVKHLTLSYAQNPFADALTDSNSSLVFDGNKQLQQISTDNLHINENAINNLPLDNLLHVERLKEGVTGEKLFREATIGELSFDGLFNSIPKSFFKTNEEKNLNDSRKIDFHGDINVKNLKVRGIDQMNVTAFMSDVLLNEKGKKLVLNGNLLHHNELKIGNLQADSISRTFTNNFMTINSDQIIAASTFINKFYTTTLTASAINGEKFSVSNIATVNSPSIIKPKTRFMDISIVRNLNVEEPARSNGVKSFMETIKRHIIGTETKDLFQIYNGRVTIKGSLSLQDVNFASAQSDLIVNNMQVSQNIRENYWMKNVRQKITAPIFTINNDLQTTSGVIIKNLNEYPMEKYLQLNAEKPQQEGGLIVKFEDVVVAGDVKGHRNNLPSFIFTLNNNVVPRNSIVPVNLVGNVEFRNELLIQKLRTGAINDQEVTSLVNKNHQVILMEAPISIKNLEIKKNLIVDRDFFASTYNNINLEQFSSNAFRLSQEGINIDSIILNDFDASNLTVVSFEGKNFDAMMKRFEEEFASSNSADRMRSLSVHGDLTLKSNVFVERINSENVNELLNSLALKSSGGVLNIGGRKSFKGNLNSKILTAEIINSQSAYRLLHRSLSRSEKQILRENLFVGHLNVKSLHTNALNDNQWNEFVSKKDLGKPLFINLRLNEMIVGDLTSSFSSFDFNLLMQSALFPKRSNWNYIDVMNATTAFFSDTAPLQQLFKFGIDKVSPQVIFANVNILNTPKFFMRSVVKPTLELNSLNYQTINLFELINDSVKNNQPQPEIISGAKTILQGSRFDTTNLIIGEKCSFYSTLINDVNVLQLNQTLFRKNDLSFMHAGKSFNYLHVDEFDIGRNQINGIFPEEIVTPYSRLNMINFAHLEADEITTYSVNGYSLPYFLEIRLRKFGAEQIVGSSIAMKSAHFTAENLIIPFINDVEIDQCMFTESDQHQEFKPHLNIAGRVTFIGPSHINKINGEDFEKLLSNSVSRHKRFSTRHLSLQNVELKNGLKISHIINDREIQELLNSGAHSPKLRDLLALISNVQKQEMIVDNQKLSRSNLRPRTMYLDADNNINTQYSILRSQMSEESCNSQNEIHVEPHARGFVVSAKNHFNFDLPSVKVEAALACNENKIDLKWSFDGNHERIFNQSLEINHEGGTITSEDIFTVEGVNGNIFMLIRNSLNIVSIRLDKTANKWINWMDRELTSLNNHVRIVSVVQNVHREIYLVASLVSNDDVLIYKYDDLKDEFSATQKISSTTKFDIIRSVHLNDRKISSTFLILAQSKGRKIIIYRLQRDTFVFQQILDNMREDISDVIVLRINDEPFIVLSKKSGIFCFYQWRGVENWQIKQCGKFENLKHMKSFDFLNKQRIFLASSIKTNSYNSINALVIHRQGETF